MNENHKMLLTIDVMVEKSIWIGSYRIRAAYFVAYKKYAHKYVLEEILKSIPLRRTFIYAPLNLLHSLGRRHVEAV